MEWFVFVAMVLALVGGIFLLRRKSEQFPQKLLREYYVLFIVGLAAVIILYVAYAVNSQSQGGYVVALSCFFGVLAACVIGRLLLERSLDKKSVVGKTLLATGLALLAFLLVYGFFSVWNPASMVPSLLFGYAFGVALVGCLTSARLGLSSFHKELHVVQLMEYVSVLSAVLCGALALSPTRGSLEAVGIILIAVFLTLVLSKEYFSLRSAFLASVLGVIGMLVFGQVGRWSVITGSVGFFILSVLGVYYSSSRYRVVRTVLRSMKDVSYAGAWAFEGVLASLALVILMVFAAYSLGVRSALSGWYGVALSVIGLVALGPYILSRFDAISERIKAVFLVFTASLAILLAFAVYQQEMVRRLGGLGNIVNLAKVEVVLAVVLGVALVLLWAWLSSRFVFSAEKAESVEARLHALGRKALASVIFAFAGVFIVAGILRAESLAGFIAGLFVGSGVLGLWAVFTGAAIDCQWRLRSGTSSFALAAALLALLLAPLVIQ